MDTSDIEKLKSIPMVLSEKSWKSIIRNIENPIQPNDALKKAFLEHSKAVKKSNRN